jgi:tellurite resistance protein TerC
MDYSIWLWVGFAAFVVVALAVDLGIFHRTDHEITPKEAASSYATWLALATLFGIGVFVFLGVDKGLEFITGYAIELSLSVDNIFVFLVIFSDFAVPARYRHRVLFYGIVGALVFRGAFIAVGVTLLNLFHWVVYLFGAFLIFTSLRLLVRKSKEARLEQNPLLRLAHRFLPVTSAYDRQRFITRQGGKLMLTPLALVVLVVESTDLVFALDSVPAILGVTRDPFIVYTSNVFVILGLRALFFLLDGVLHRFRYLKVGLSLVLAFIGVKMLVSNFYEIPVTLSLAVIVGILATTMCTSYLIPIR